MQRIWVQGLSRGLAVALVDRLLPVVPQGEEAVVEADRRDPAWGAAVAVEEAAA